MITDIFARRYEHTTLLTSMQERDERFLVQAWRLMSDRIYPIYIDGKANDPGNKSWESVHQQLTMELGVRELHPRFEGYYTKWNGNNHWNAITHAWGTVCEKYFHEPISKSPSADVHMKNRLSLVELVFRRRHLESQNALVVARQQADQEKIKDLGHKPGKAPPSQYWATTVGTYERSLSEFERTADELNERFRLSRIELRYHNGFIQRSTDTIVESQIATPFWQQVGSIMWANVDLDMKEAVDRRDNSQRDAVFYAARALESTIKIVSDNKGWTHGKENGAHSFIDNLSSTKNGHWLATWEAKLLKSFFTDVRNPFGHGPGSGTMPQLAPEQTDWAIEFCMSWIKSLVRRS